MGERTFPIYKHRIKNIREHERENFAPSYIALAMSMNYQGISVTPQDVFRFVHGVNASREGLKAPDFRTMAFTARQLSKNSLFPLRATEWTKDMYQRLSERRGEEVEDIPFSIMDEYLLGRNALCIIRAQRKLWLVTGVEPIARSYIVYDPYNNIAATYEKSWFDLWWSQPDRRYPNDPPGEGYPMLTVEKDKKYF